MIKDKIENCSNYFGISEKLKIGFQWLKNQNLDEIELGKYYIKGDKIYANVQEYETKTDAKYEAHNKYIDIQCVIKGEEKIGFTDRKNCKTCVNYDLEKDIEFFDAAKEEFVSLLPNEFIVFFPNDAHKPSLDLYKKTNVKKVVVKVPID